MDDIKIPRVSKRKDDPKDIFASIVDEFKDVLKDSVHPDAKSQAYETKVSSILNRLLTSAATLEEEVQPGHGVFSMIAVLLRATLYLKEENVRRDKEIISLKKELQKIKTKPQGRPR